MPVLVAFPGRLTFAMKNVGHTRRAGSPRKGCTMRIWPESPPFSYFHILKISENQTFFAVFADFSNCSIDNLSTKGDILSLQGQWHACCNK
jgi:hypothetical protein